MTSRAEWSLLAALALLCVAGLTGLALRGQGSQGSTGEAVEAASAEPAEPPSASIPLRAVDRSLTGDLPNHGQWRGCPELADLNRDGKLDLVASVRRWDSSTPADGLHVWLGDGAGHWTPSEEGLRRDLGYGGAEVLDVNADGWPDIAFSGHDVLPTVYLGGADGRWTAGQVSTDSEGIAADVALGDFDRDGRSDLAVLGFYPPHAGLQVLAGDGLGGFVLEEKLLPDWTYGSQVRALDLDGDGALELVAATSSGPRVWSRDGAAGWIDRSSGLPTPEVGGSELAFDAHDLGGDGRQELLIAGMVYDGHAPLVVYEQGSLSWIPALISIPSKEASFDVKFAQLAPGAEACIVSACPSGVTVFERVAPDRFEAAYVVEDTLGVLNLCVGDLDGDGLDEVVYVGTSGVHVLRLAGADGGQG